MTTAELINPPPPPSARQERSATPNARVSDAWPPTARERLGEIVPLIFVVPVAGPPVVVVVGPWVLFALMLTGPFLLLVTFVLAAVILVAATAAVLAPPYLLVRHVRHHRTGQRDVRRPIHRIREPHPVGRRTRAHRPRLIGGPAAKAPATVHVHNQTQTRHRSGAL